MRFEGRVSSIEVSPSESSEASLSLWEGSAGGLAGAGGRIVKGIMAILSAKCELSADRVLYIFRGYD